MSGFLLKDLSAVCPSLIPGTRMPAMVGLETHLILFTSFLFQRHLFSFLVLLKTHGAHLVHGGMGIGASSRTRIASQLLSLFPEQPTIANSSITRGGTS